jgi:uncharacterized protein (DUF952 family)
MITRYILHSVIKEAFYNDTYGTQDLNKFGFIHCSDLDTYYLVAPNFKDENKERVLLVIDTTKLKSKLKYEDVCGVKFPHIYGLINKEAIVEVLPHLWSKEKEWFPNVELKKYIIKLDENSFKRKI